MLSEMTRGKVTQRRSDTEVAVMIERTVNEKNFSRKVKASKIAVRLALLLSDLVSCSIAECHKLKEHIVHGRRRTLYLWTHTKLHA